MKPCVYCGDAVDRSKPARSCFACMTKRKPYVLAALRAVHRAVEAGRLKNILRQFCVDCGAPAWEYDHRDYSKPLDVEPTCRSCNARRGPAKFPMLEAA